MNPRQLEKTLAREAREHSRKRALDLSAAQAKAVAQNPTVTMVPAPVAPPGYKKVLASPEDFEADAPEPFNVVSEVTPTFIEVEIFSKIAARQTREVTPSAAVFRSLCATAIAFGGISQQDFISKFGEVIPRNVDKSLEDWPLPAPNVVRDILNLFSTITEDQFSGSKLPWRHAQSVTPAAGPEPQD